MIIDYRVAYSETSDLFKTVYHYNKVLKRYRMVRCQVLVIGGGIGQSASGV